MSKPVYRCTMPGCDVVDVYAHGGKRVVLRTADAVERFNAATGRAIRPNSAAALCGVHVGPYVTGRRVERNDASVSVVDVVERTVTRDARQDLATGERDGIGAVTREEMRAMLRSAHARRVADADAVYDAILDAFIARLGEHFARTNVQADTDERARILRGACMAMVDNGRHTVKGERVHAVSLDATNAPEYASTWGSVHGLTLADTLAADVERDEYDVDGETLYRVAGQTFTGEQVAALAAANPAAWAAAQAG